MATIMSPSSASSSSSKTPVKSARKFAERMRLLLVGSLAVPPFSLLEPKNSVDVKRTCSSEGDHGNPKTIVGRHAKSSSLTGRGFRYWGPRDVEGPPRIQRNLPQYQSERAGPTSARSRASADANSSEVVAPPWRCSNTSSNNSNSKSVTRENIHKDRSHSFHAGRRFSYQETGDHKETHVHHPHHPVTRRDPDKSAVVPPYDVSAEAGQSHSTPTPTPPEESIYENVRPPAAVMEQNVLADEPPPPPQPPYSLQGLEEPRSGVRLERDRERRSLRKLTKDSGYETSQYAESDYANVEYEGSDAGAHSDRSPTDPEFSPRSSAVYMDSYRTDVWRAGQLYWSAHGSSSSSSNSNSTRPSHRSSSSHPSRHHHQERWDQRHVSRSNRGYNSSDDKPRSPVAPSSSSGHQHRKTASYIHVQPVDNRGERNLGRYSSTDSLSSYSSVFSYPPFSVSSAKSTPALCHDPEIEDGQSPPPQPPHAINNSRSTPNLEELDADGMVTRPFKKGSSVYNDLASKSGFNFTPMVQGRPYWEDHESREDYESQLRSAAVSAYQGQHSRQVSSQSSSSDHTSSSYSASQHSRQVSSQSSFSEEDYRIQSIKEEFHQRTSQDYLGHLPIPPYYEKEVASTLPPYSHRYYSSDNLVTSYTGDRDADLKKAQHYSWAKSQPDLKGVTGDTGSPSKSPTSPPPPPLRDSSSLKYSRFNSSHEKYPSWPAAAGSPTESTDIPVDGHCESSKTGDKNAYGRNKKFLPGFTQNLKPVIENSERARHESSFNKRVDKTYDLSHSAYVPYDEESPSPYRKGIHDGQYSHSSYFHERSHCLGKDFEAPSPPQRDASLKKFGSLQLDRPCVPLDDDDPPPPYSPTGSSSGGSSQFYCSDNRSQDQGYWSPDCKDQPLPSERDVEESKEALAKDDDSGSDGTPLMDRLRRESQQGLQPLWASKEDGPTTSGSTGRESVTSSNSSQETLKWHGSNSDLSVNSDRARGNGGVETIVHSARVQPPQRHNSESVLYYGNGAPNNKRTNCAPRERKRDSPPQKESSSQWANQVHKNNLVNAGVGIQRLAASYAYTSLVSPVGADERRPEALAREEFRALPTPEYAKPLSVAERIQDLERQARSGHGGSGGSGPPRSRTRAAVKKERETESARPKAASPTFPRRKVDVEGGGSEKVEEPKALYLDPEKKHRVSDPELKAIQKQAVLSFFERQTSLGSGTGRRQSHSLPRDSMHEFRNYASSVESSNRLERVPEASSRDTSIPSETAEDPARDASCRLPRLMSSSQRGHQRSDSGSERISAPTSPVKSNPGIVRPVPLRQTDCAPRVAIYYNTHTQTDSEDGHVDSALPTPTFSSTFSSSARTYSRELLSVPGDGQGSRPRKDAAIQTDWPWQHLSGSQAPQSTSNAITTKATDANEKTSPEESISTQLLSRLTKTHGSSKSDPPPPQRPPKRPHLQAASSPPPLLPRASSTSPAHQVPLKQLPAPPPPRVASPAASTRSPSPDLPLPPPPPPPTSEGEEEEEDVPLPPPPTLNEVGQLVSDVAPPTPSPLPRTAGSPPLSYPKDSYMSYRNERHPSRHGFDGNYRRTTSPLNCSSGEETDESSKADQQENMDSVTTSLTPTAWERWHNIGRPGSTVVFTSTDIKSSGALKSSGSDKAYRKHSQPQLSVNTKQPVDSSSADNFHGAEGHNLTDTTHSLMPNSRRMSLDSSRHQKRHGPAADLHRHVSNPSPVSAHQHCNGELSSPSPKSCSLESVHSPPPQSASKVHNGHVSSASSTSSLQPSGASRKNSSADSQCTDRVRSSLRNEPEEVKSCSVPTIVRSPPQQRQVEVMTQTTPSIAKCARPKRKEEVECEQLSHDLASQLSAEERLLQVLLVPKQLKTAADYMEGIFEMDQSKGTPHRVSVTSSSPSTALDKIKRSPEAAPLPANSAYFTTSESKAKFLTRYRQDMDIPESLDINSAELGKKKEELVKSITRKLEILRMEHLAIQDEIVANQDLGRSVTSRVEKLAKPNELDKYTLHVEEIDKITSLLLGLSGRLARAENALMGFPNNNHHPEERRILEAKRDKLLEQHEEAKKLKENIDRRSLQVSNFLHKYLSPDEYADYDHFIKMKSKLLMDSREIDEKIKLGEEQMLALTESLTKNT